MAREDGETRRGFRIRGRVQGVGFRWWTQRKASELGLGGSVRNLPDGCVEVHAVGPEEVIRRLERALHQGPPASRVERVDPIPTDPSAPSDEFVIAR